ncbi:MAG TPA: hypothetical protein VEH79_05280 [Gaiellaceae bacterium]|nr:hypothetical protein [Gaiellaceae bacterium]
MWPALLSHGEQTSPVLGVGLAGLVMLALGTAAARTAVVATSIAVLGSAYALHLVLEHPPVDTRAALFGAGLLATAELACWSAELRREVAAPEAGRHLRRLAAEIALCLGGLALAALVLAATDIGHHGGVAVQIAGAGAAVALAALAVDTLRHPRG